jgi:4-amino-4-deoxy-L-arabinose transferase-like glycosyltransferase
MMDGAKEIFILAGLLGVVLIPPVAGSVLITAKKRRKQSLGYLVLSIYAAMLAAAGIWYFFTDGSNDASGVFVAFAFICSVLMFQKYRSYNSQNP